MSRLVRCGAGCHHVRPRNLHWCTHCHRRLPAAVRAALSNAHAFAKRGDGCAKRVLAVLVRESKEFLRGEVVRGCLWRE